MSKTINGRCLFMHLVLIAQCATHIWRKGEREKERKKWVLSQTTLTCTSEKRRNWIVYSSFVTFKWTVSTQTYTLTHEDSERKKVFFKLFLFTYAINVIFAFKLLNKWMWNMLLVTHTSVVCVNLLLFFPLGMSQNISLY